MNFKSYLYKQIQCALSLLDTIHMSMRLCFNIHSVVLDLESEIDRNDRIFCS